MTQSTYAWMGSQLHLVLEDELAESYNRAQTAFFKAQSDHKVRTGSEWNHTEPLWIEWDEKAREAWDKIARLVNLLIEINGGSLSIMQEDCTSDYLVKVE